jgi:hypothetical protein
MVAMITKKLFSLLVVLLVSTTHNLQAEIANRRVRADYSRPVMLKQVSSERVAKQKQLLAKQLANQKRVRVGTVTVAALVAAAAVGGTAYWCLSTPDTALQAQPVPQTGVSAGDVGLRVWEHQLEREQELRTLSGAVKHGLQQGVIYAIGSFAAMTVWDVLKRMGLISWSKIKTTLYPTPADLWQAQDLLFNNAFEYTQNSLMALEQNILFDVAKKPFEEFVHWRELASVDLQSSTALLVFTIEHTVALSQALLERMRVPDTTTITVLTDQVTALTEACDECTLSFELMINAATLEEFDLNATYARFMLKKMMALARDTMQQLAPVIDSL